MYLNVNYIPIPKSNMNYVTSGNGQLDFTSNDNSIDILTLYATGNNGWGNGYANEYGNNITLGNDAEYNISGDGINSKFPYITDYRFHESDSWNINRQKEVYLKCI